MALSMVSFGSNFFGFNYHCRGDDGNPAEQKCKIIVRSYIVARNLFRAVTEEQVFFYQKTVPAQVLCSIAACVSKTVTGKENKNVVFIT